MNFLHKRDYLNSGDVVVVNCSHQCNIILMDDRNFANYKRGQSFKHFGGFYKMFPTKLPVPSTGYWNVVLDLGGGSATISHSISFLKRS